MNGKYMKYFITAFLIYIFTVNLCFAQTGMKSRDIISTGRSDNNIYSEIEVRTNRDADMNKINNELNFYRSKNDSIYNQRIMELEKEKSQIINKR